MTAAALSLPPPLLGVLFSLRLVKHVYRTILVVESISSVQCGTDAVR